jgi:itaconyl-CoA hydratase
VSTEELIGTFGYFEDFEVGQKLRHFRGATIDEVENNLLSKLVMNTAQAHWNEDVMRNSALGEGRLVFGLITASMVFGLASQDTAEHALSESGLDHVRFTNPVHHGDTIYAYTEVLKVSALSGNTDAGEVRFRHWGVNQDGVIVCEFERSVLIKRRSSWRPA